MSRQNYRRGHSGNLNQYQGTYYLPSEIPPPFSGYDAQYSYQSNGYRYFDFGSSAVHPYTAAQNLQPSEYWYGEGVAYDYSTMVRHTATPAPFSATHSIFSPDAPEFVSKHSQITEEIKVENLVQIPKKKKKKKKKKTSNIEESKVPNCEDTEAKSLILNANEKTNSDDTQLKEKKKKKKASHIQMTTICDTTKETEKSAPSCSNEKKMSHQKKLDKTKSVTFKEETNQMENMNPKSSTENSLVKKDVCDSWPKPWTNVNKSPEANNRQSKVISFADKLKSPAPSKSPFLDWRDQRTNAANQPIKQRILIHNTEENVLSPPQSTPKKTSDDDGFVTVSRKKVKDKKNETVTEVTKCTPDLNKSAECDAKKKLEKEKRKLREKEKKKRARDEKLLSEKLAPKGQKVTIITPKIMEKYLQSSRSASASSKSVIKLSDDMFPALGKPNVGVKGNVSESESEWETIEVIKKEEPIVQRSVKRTDPIQFDLMALITKKSNKKKPSSASDSAKKNKNRPGLVANVLDRSAPTLSRGKIRNKKRKLSEIRKALLAAKAKRKAVRELQASTLPSKGTRTHALHSKKFREYCDQMLTDEIDLLARDMLYHLRMFQDRVYKKDPIKARMKKRLVAGLREVTKQVERNRVKIIFLAPDIQRCPETGGLDEAVKRLLDIARRLDLPIVYALSRRKIGRVLMKKVPVSCCGILNYQATEETWKQLTQAVTVAREQYQLKVQPSLNTSDTAEKETQLNVPIENVANPEVKKELVQTDTLLELMKLSLKEEP